RRIGKHCCEFIVSFDPFGYVQFRAGSVQDRGQRTDDRGQRTDDRGQRTEDRRQRTEDRRQRTEMVFNGKYGFGFIEWFRVCKQVAHSTRH
ncbi:MAG: hypothetical protein OEW48_17815, partial [Phycisphaerae bacterium]|nr:hypothetical protein [Phycisphaerae bacterium]